MTRWQRELERIAEYQHGLVFTADLKRLGLDDTAIRAAALSLRRVRRGVYSLAQVGDDRAAHLEMARAVVMQGADRLALSHVTAAAFHGWPVSDLGEVHVTAVGVAKRRGRRNGVYTHSGPLLHHHSCVRDDVELTNPLRTLLDCATTLSLEEALVMADHVLHEGQADIREFRQGVEERHSRTGISVARQVAELADAQAESPGETRTRLAIVQSGLAVESQAVIRDRAGEFVGRVDLRLRDYPVIIEFDGRMKYRANGDVEVSHWREKLRHDALQETGHFVVRVTWRELADPEAIVTKVRGGIVRARRLGFTA